MGRLDTNVVSIEKERFSANCRDLLREACEHLYQKGIITTDVQDETISAYIKLCIKESETARARNIGLATEVQLYDWASLSAHSVKQSPRIDMKFCTWSRNDELSFYVEAKILVEHNVKRTTGSLNAKNLQRRYIKTGIDNYVYGRYPQKGCILGYVLEGDAHNITEGINRLLSLNKREDECICISCVKEDKWIEAMSKLKKGTLTLTHYFARFSK